MPNEAGAPFVAKSKIGCQHPYMRRNFLLLSLLLLFLPKAEPQLSNHGKTKTGGYITAGDRIYMIGTQDGNFPDMGRHVEGEMGGLWLHPIKLIDGFWAKITDADNGDSTWLSDVA